MKDEPGVFANVANTLSEFNISIEAAIQKEPSDGSANVDIVIVTQNVVERVMVEAQAKLSESLEASGAKLGDLSRIRIEPLD